MRAEFLVTGSRGPRLGGLLPIVGLNLLAVAASVLAIPGFASPQNLAAALGSALPLLVLAVGQTVVLITAGIDLSCTAIVGLSSVAGGLTAFGFTEQDQGSGAASVIMVAMVASGAGVGLVNGIAVGALRMPPFMATLATGLFASGLAVWLSHLSSSGSGPASLPLAFVAVGSHTGIAVALAASVGFAVWFWLDHTRYGAAMRAVGYNARTARVSGVDVPSIVLSAYVASGVLAALAAVLMTGALETASPTHGRQLLLDVVGAAVIGGASFGGGRGTVPGTVLGVTFLTVVGNSLTNLNLSDFVVTMIKGGLILAAALNERFLSR